MAVIEVRVTVFGTSGIREYAVARTLVRGQVEAMGLALATIESLTPSPDYHPQHREWRAMVRVTVPTR